MPIRLHCNELRALYLATNALCRSAEIGALLLKCVLIVYIWPEKVYIVGADYSSLYSMEIIAERSEEPGQFSSASTPATTLGFCSGSGPASK